MMQTVTIAQHVLGPGHPCFVIAEAGVNHNGDIALAQRMIDAAADAGVHAIKFQTFDPELLVSADAPKADYQVDNTGEGGNQLEMLRKLALPKSAYCSLLAHAEKKGLLFLSTPFDEDSADFL